MRKRTVGIDALAAIAAASVVFRALGYILGFPAGKLFEKSYGEGLNSMWIIWLICFAAAILMGIIVNFLVQRKTKC